MRLATTAALFALHANCAGVPCPCEDLVIGGVDDFIMAYFYGGFELEVSMYDGTYTRTSPISNVVAQPGATLPYSEFKGLKISPNFVLNAII